jgi:hypothetical protein
MRRAFFPLFLTVWMMLAVLHASGQSIPDAQLNESGQIEVDGHTMPYLIRHLPPSSFPQLPAAVQDELNRRGCTIPQTYEAHGPENVVQANLEHKGLADWAVLCSEHGTVSLLVFFSATVVPVVLASAPETERLQANPASGTLGFDWAIDVATPEKVHQAQTGMRRRPALLDHDALADSLVEQKTVYRYYTGKIWIMVDTSD